MENLSIGNELKDSYSITEKWVTNGINWLTDIDEFYKERAIIEREYATKLRELTKRHFDKKAKNSSRLSVGDEPQITPGSLESASVVLWNEVLTQTEAIAKERDHFALEISNKICSNLDKLQVKLNKIARHIATINEFLDLEKKATEDDVSKAKKNYDALCQGTENARQKTEKSAGDKYLRRLEEKEVEMNIGKNNYLIRISVANRLKDKYYFQDLPELLDYFQDLNESRVGILNKLLKNASIIERNSNDKVKEHLHEIDSTIEQNNPKLDTAMYIKHNAVAWKEPQDFYFIPCDFWHDDESLIIKEPELTDLKKRLNVSLNGYAVSKESTLSAKQKLEEVSQKRKASDDSLTLKFDMALDDALTLLQKFMREDSARVKNEVEIEIIQNFAGDQDLSYVEVKKEKKRTSAGKATAIYPYEATGNDEISMAQGEDLDVVEEDDGSGWTMVRLTQSGKQGLAPTSYLEINKNYDGNKKKGPSVAPKRGAKRVQYVEALYDYTADEDNELSIVAGDRIVLIQEDTDGSGWTEGELNGARGLFPTSYVKKI
ncbi:CIC11C00000003637 [Sungouiella intermedia]|uniref:Protein BZZ1 n=1 Tax=Sungouiella intermedia TaxID=45354 RepID=A0A1L0GDR0_9ASCO|nr:CIC11C00000003637 [[Candida] intermedia]